MQALVSSESAMGGFLGNGKQRTEMNEAGMAGVRGKEKGERWGTCKEAGATRK